MINYLQLKIWNSEHSSVWREIVSRFGQSDYDDETKRKKHMATLKAEWEAKQYQRDRVVQYPSIGDQLDMIYKAGQGGDAFQAAIQAVKDKYPKG
jgi:hypothetical protein